MSMVTKQSTFRYHGDLNYCMWLLSSQCFIIMETCVRKLVSSSHDLDKAVINSSFSASLLAISRAENTTDCLARTQTAYG